MNHNATESLIELREHYKGLLAQYNQASAHAKVQLEHVEALLLESLLPTPELPTQNVTLITEQPAQPKAIAAHQAFAPHQAVVLAPATSAAPTEVESINAQASRQSSKPEKAIALPQDSAQTPESIPDSASADPTSLKPAPKRGGKAPKSKSASAKRATTRKRGTDMVLDLPAEYAGLRKLDAVALVLESSFGNPMHIDTIIDRLYGTLPEEVHKAEKVRMSNVMARGIKENLWQRAIVPGCYLVTVAEPEPDAASATTKASASRKPKKK